MTDVFTNVKEKLSIEALLNHYGGAAKGKFVNPSPCCSHNDCFSLDSDKGLFRCFSCGNGGSVIDLVMAVDDCDEAEALRKCADIAGVEIASTSAPSTGSGRTERKESIQERMYRLAAEHYEAAMEGSPGFEYFCKTRGHKPATLKKMRAGWSDGGLLPFLEGKGFDVEDVVKYGLAKVFSSKENGDKSAAPSDPSSASGGGSGRTEKKPRDYFWKGLVIFPVIDHAGKVVSFTCKDPEKKYKGLMLQGVKKTWFLNYAALGRYDELFIVEGENDVASLMDAGFDNVIGTAGAPGAEQVKLLRNFCAGKTVYLWFDKDPAKDPSKNEGGAHHTRFLCDGLRAHNIEVKITVHPGGAKDPDEFIQGISKK